MALPALAQLRTQTPSWVEVMRYSLVSDSSPILFLSLGEPQLQG